MLPEVPFPTDLAYHMALCGFPEMPLPAGESFSAPPQLGGELSDLLFPEQARSSETSIINGLMELPLPAAAAPSSSEGAGSSSRSRSSCCGESVLVQLARELGIASPVAASATHATTFTAPVVDTSATADADKIVLIPALKVRRRRGSKLAKDPDWTEEPEERMPSFVDVDLSGLVRVKRSACSASQSSDPEQPPAEQL